MENIVKGLILIGPSALSNDTRLLSLYSKVSPSTVFEVYMRGGHQARLKQQCRFNPVLVKAYTCFADCVWQMLTEVDLRTALPWTPRWVELRARTIRETIGLTLEAWHRWVRKDEEGKDTAETPLEWQQVRHLSQRHVVEEVMRTRAKVAAVTVPLAALFVKATEALFHTILAREEGMPGADNAVDDFFQAQNDLRTCEKQYAAVLREAFGNRLNLLEVVKEWAATVRPRNVRVAGRAEGARVGEGGAEGAEEEEGDGVDTPDPGRLATAYMLASAHWPGLRPAETEPGSACPEADPTWMFTGITGGLPAVVRIPAENIRFHPLGLQGAKAPFLVPTPGGNEVRPCCLVPWLWRVCPDVGCPVGVGGCAAVGARCRGDAVGNGPSRGARQRAPGRHRHGVRHGWTGGSACPAARRLAVQQRPRPPNVRCCGR
ncbi:hypothetical protein CALCODRAFT_225975 [Calocera cornea HHB12733]|uniref:Uncharacterized protein n=1 Tax=Calocera cornea HHB12733 TaxID=1353952 RepID=A0A165C0M3_9BASI|nr:hypothetical protein CALCODRAFT_225975 [Calocera cornea HHB12733]